MPPASKPSASAKPVTPAVTVTINANEKPSIGQQPTLVIDPQTIQPAVTSAQINSQEFTAILVSQSSQFNHEGHPTQSKKSKPTIQDIIENRISQDVNTKQEDKEPSEDTLNVEGSTSILDITQGSGSDEELNTEIQETATTLAKYTNKDQNTKASNAQSEGNPEKMIDNTVEQSLERYYEQHQEKHDKEAKNIEDKNDKQESKNNNENNRGVIHEITGGKESQTYQTPLVKIIVDSSIKKQPVSDFEQNEQVPRETAEIIVHEVSNVQNKTTTIPETIIDVKLGLMGDRQPASTEDKEKGRSRDVNHHKRRRRKHKHHKKHKRRNKHKHRQHRHGHKKHNSAREELVQASHDEFLEQMTTSEEGEQLEMLNDPGKDKKRGHKHRKHNKKHALKRHKHRHHRNGRRKHKKHHRAMNRRKPHQYDEQVYNHDSKTSLESQTFNKNQDLSSEQEMANPEMLTEEELRLLQDTLKKHKHKRRKHNRNHRRKHRRRHGHKRRHRHRRRHRNGKRKHKKSAYDQGLEYSYLQSLEI